MPPIVLGQHRYRMCLPTVEELETFVFPLIPGTDTADQFDNLAKLMRMDPLGFLRGEEHFFSGRYIPKMEEETKIGGFELERK
ncbi:MAG: hypothetical protein H6765_05680 [Candidatus Peribacteria bacterium]|nr:MAG: hypothetical protein H6765_05680 [Candidatus Peribacteria bacterium]